MNIARFLNTFKVLQSYKLSACLFISPHFHSCFVVCGLGLVEKVEQFAHAKGAKGVVSKSPFVRLALVWFSKCSLLAMSAMARVSQFHFFTVPPGH